MTKKKMKIIGMHCVSCAMTIDFDLEDVIGVKSAKTSFAREECEVLFDEEKVDPELILKTIEKTGYKAEMD